MLKDGEVLQKRYRILHKLGKGGMGLVYLATDLKMSDNVVIKQSVVGSVESLRQDKDYGKLSDDELQNVVESSRQAFEREAKLLYGLRHHALPRVLAYDEDEQFLVMDYVLGKDLSELLSDRLRQRQGPFPPDQVLGWADQILDALDYLHTEFDEPIIHRDIKPANLKLTPKGQIVLLDFGLAKGARPGMATAQSILAGTKEYAPIEQLDEDENARQKTDPRSDLYSLSMTLHHLLSGQLPATTISRVSAKAQGRPDPLRPVHELSPSVPVAVSEVLQRAGAVFAKDRLATAAAMRQALRQARQKSRPTPPAITVSPVIDKPATIVRPQYPRPQPESSLPKTIESFTDDLNGVKLEMVYVPSDEFTMGSKWRDNERVPHKVTMSAFYIGKFQITQVQWKAMMGDKLKPDFKDGDDLPMVNISWDDAKEFCQKLQQLTKKAYRLPSEAEWEYACRAGTTTEFAFGDSLSSDQANFNGNYPYGRAPKSGYRGSTMPVGSFQPNDFGLYDMHGNVWEWCEDVGHDSYICRVVRGGSWYVNGDNCRSAFRGNYVHRARLNDIGFRVVVSARTSNT